MNAPGDLIYLGFAVVIGGLVGYILGHCSGTKDYTNVFKEYCEKNNVEISVGGQRVSSDELVERMRVTNLSE